MAATTETEGLRERKKRRTRQAIGEAAMELFKAHGFDAVTVADVARAAEVSEKTVFNYFPAKEDLVMHGGEERLAAVIDAIRTRPPGTPLVKPFRDVTMALVEAIDRGPVEDIVAVPRLVAESKTLRDRLFLAWEEEAAALAPVVAEEIGAREGDLVPAVVARTLAWARRMVFRAAFQRLLAGEDRHEVASDLRKQARRVYDQLERGLAGYGVKPR
jgi:AcrR family transcriptional regulator